MPAGGILPLTDQLDSHLRNPERLTILVVHGADGDFTLVEDDCSESPDSPVQRTHFRYQVRENRATFSMETACTGEAVAPGNRIFHLEIRNVPAVRQVSVSAGQLQGETRQRPRGRFPHHLC